MADYKIKIISRFNLQLQFCELVNNLPKIVVLFDAALEILKYA